MPRGGYEPALDRYRASRCSVCLHFNHWHHGDHCNAGEHSMRCRCEGFVPVEATP